MSVANAQGAFSGSGLLLCNSAAMLEHAYASNITSDQAAPTVDASAKGNLTVCALVPAASCHTMAQPSVVNLV
jgi:hypothetical protein